MKRIPSSWQRRAKVGFREKPVAGMNRLAPELKGDFQNLVGVEVALLGWRGPQQVGLVGHLDVACFAVGLGVDGNGLDAEFLAGG